MKRILSNVAVAVFTALALLSTLPDVSLTWSPFWTLGYDAAPDGRITDVIPGLPADRAGIQPGDAIDITRASPHERRFVGQLSVTPPHERVTYEVRRGASERAVTLTAQQRPRTFIDNATNLFLTVTSLAFVLIPAWLVFVRPSPLTWSFFIYALGQASLSISFQQLRSDALVQTINVIQSAFGCGTVAAIPFAIMFPRTSGGPRTRLLTYCLAVVAGVVFVLDVISGYAPAVVATLRGSPSFAVFVSQATSLLFVTTYVVAAALFILNYIYSGAVERKRMQWVALGFIVGDGIQQLLGIFQGLYSITPPIWILNVLQCFQIAIPLSVAYAVLKHRVIDVRFFMSRALMYGITTTILVAVLALLEYFVSRTVEARNLGAIVEILGAVLVGVAIRGAHVRMETTMDRLIFRKLHDAEKRLKRTGGALAFAKSSTAIDEMIAAESAEALELDAVEVVRRIDADDPFVLHLRAERAPLPHPAGFAVPLVVRHELLGYVVYGHHLSGADLDPNERSLLVNLTEHAAHAYDHVASEERLADNERLRTENGVLRSLLTPAAGHNMP